MKSHRHLIGVVNQLTELAKKHKKKTAFFIGSTAKVNKGSFYFTPVRELTSVFFAGAVVYSEHQAFEICRDVDGKVDIILVDAEKKILSKDALTGTISNIERLARETVTISSLWTYKGNDLTVEAVDLLIEELFSSEAKGVGGKNAAILGAGNLGSKLALKLVERGMNVAITRRNKRKLHLIGVALNYIKPTPTIAKLTTATDHTKACINADVVIGCARGNPVIYPETMEQIKDTAIIIDVGKGTLTPESIKLAYNRKIPIYRLVVTAAIEGLIQSLIFNKTSVSNLGRKTLHNNICLVTRGLLGSEGEVVVDNVNQPQYIYGLADGRGDFVRRLSAKQQKIVESVKEYIVRNET